MNILNLFICCLSITLLKYIEWEQYNYDCVVAINKKNSIIKNERILDEYENINNSENEEDEYEDYLDDKGSNEFEQVNYKYLDYVNFTIIKSQSTYQHAVNELFVFLGSQYSTDEKIVIHVKLIDILSLLFVHYRDNLSNFEHIINSFQDRNKLMNSVEGEYFREFIDERDNYIFDVKNTYYNSQYVNKEKETILNKKKTIYEIFQKNWKTDGYRFYSVKNKKKYYYPRKINLDEPRKRKNKKKKKQKNIKCVNMVCKPLKIEYKSLNKPVNSPVDDNTDVKTMKGEQHINGQAEDKNDVVQGIENVQQEKKEIMDRFDIQNEIQNQVQNDIENEIEYELKNDDSNNNIEESDVMKSYKNQICNADENRTPNVGYVRENSIGPGIAYRMRKDFFLKDSSFNVITLINSITSNRDNKVVTKLHEGLTKLGITTIEHLIRYTNILAIFFSYDIFDELYLQIKLVKEYFGLIKYKHNILDTEENEYVVGKKTFYGKYNMIDDEVFVSPNCLSVYCKLKSVWMQNRNITVKVEKSTTNSLKIMMLGDIGQGFEEEKNFDVQNIYNFMGFNELKSTVQSMKKWHLENNADFVINLGDNIPNDGSYNFIGNFQWHQLMRELFVFKKKSEKQVHKDLGTNTLSAESIANFYNDKIKEMNEGNYENHINYYNDKNLHKIKAQNENNEKENLNDNSIKMNNAKDTSSKISDLQNVSNTNPYKIEVVDHTKLVESNTSINEKEEKSISSVEERANLYEDDEESDEEEDSNEFASEAIPFYSVLGEKDYFYFPSEQIQEHYSKRIPGYFMPNNYYCVNYDFTYNPVKKNVNGDEDDDDDEEEEERDSGKDRKVKTQEKFRASFIFIDTWALMVGFPIIRNYRAFREQFNWLSKTLYESAKKSDWIFVVGHHPLISSGRRSDNYSYEEHSFHDIIRDFLFNYHVDAYFSAHDHLMEYIKFGSVDLFINGSSSRVLFDNSSMGRGYFGKIIGKLYPVSCYVLKTIHTGLKPKGCNINRYSKWYNKSDIGFSTHKLTKDELVTQFISSRTGKPLSEKIITKNKKHERKKFYDLDGFAEDRIKELEKKIIDFSVNNPDLINYKIQEFNENIEKLNLIIKKLKTKEEKEIFKELIQMNNLIFDVSDHLDNVPIEKLKIMSQLVSKYNIFFNKELAGFIVAALERAIQMEGKKTHNSSDENGSLNEEDKNLIELIESLGYQPEEFLQKYESMTSEQKVALKNKIGRNISLEDYVNRIKFYVEKKKKEKEKKNGNEQEAEEETEVVEEIDELKEIEKKRKESEGDITDEDENEIKEDQKDNEKEDETYEEYLDESQYNDEEIPLVKQVHKDFKKLANQEKKLSEQKYILLMLASMRKFDIKKYALNLSTKKERIKDVTTSNYLSNIEPRKTFFQLCIELPPDIKRIINNFSGVGKRLPFFNFINKLYDEIIKLKDSLNRISR
ncbi:phosphatase, putative [Plasmodium reichenowi]|uniref:Phosphatase, putative n=1 Tax=Plasmodium reichenowi TaxID=5854 RepID=A0A151L5T8_PLARE|nr:phosphatase, putative [Plasmodium reichenowi]KYN94296.1 phosphatase, putative [Plasmodium reichenowi]